jgi:hypothetical protein
MKKHIWFEEIGLCYARNFDEVESARSQFEQERETILDYLGEILKAVLSAASLKNIADPIRGDGWDNWWLSGAFFKFRRDSGKMDYQSGICFGIGYDHCFEVEGGGRFGFGTYVNFRLRPNRYRDLKPKIAELARELKLVFDHDTDADQLYLRSAWFLPNEEDFTLDIFEREVSQLPDLFAKIDESLAEAYAKLKAE